MIVNTSSPSLNYSTHDFSLVSLPSRPLIFTLVNVSSKNPMMDPKRVSWIWKRWPRNQDRYWKFPLLHPRKNLERAAQDILLSFFCNFEWKLGKRLTMAFTHESLFNPSALIVPPIHTGQHLKQKSPYYEIPTFVHSPHLRKWGKGPMTQMEPMVMLNHRNTMFIFVRGNLNTIQWLRLYGSKYEAGFEGDFSMGKRSLRIDIGIFFYYTQEEIEKSSCTSLP
jgi:hypothetical protein